MELDEFFLVKNGDNYHAWSKIAVYNNYLWTYDLYGPEHKDFDAGGWVTL